MKKIFNIFLGNPLFKGSFIVLTGSTIANVGSYLFHLLMGRLLGPVDYGVLESLISLSYFLGVPLSVFTIVIVKYISQEKKNKEKLSLFVKKIFRKSSFYGLFLFGCFLFAFPLLRKLLKIDSLYYKEFLFP